MSRYSTSLVNSAVAWFDQSLILGGSFDSFLAFGLFGLTDPEQPPVLDTSLDRFLNRSSFSPLLLIIDGVPTVAVDVFEALPRAVLISLFSWRRANGDDNLPGNKRYGWWGDTYPAINNDLIGSRLWLLGRSKLLPETVFKAKEYTEEALAWLVEDRVAAEVQVQAERQGLSGLAIGIKIIRGDKTAINIRFVNVWEFLSAV